MKKRIALIFLIAGLYAVLRYHIFGPVLAKDFFLYTFNKIVIFSAVLLMVQSVFISDKPEKEILRKWVFILVSLHILISLIILRPYYFESFFTKNLGFSLIGNLTLAGGALAGVLMLFKEKIILLRKKFMLLLIIFLGLHLISMGWKGWITPSSWHGMMPPITLLSFIALLIWFLKKSKESD